MKSIFFAMLIFSAQTFATTINIIGQNIGTTLLKRNKSSIKKIINTLDYYQSDINFFHNTFNRSSDALKFNSNHPYFSYDDSINKRTGTITTSHYKILNETYFPFKKYTGLLKSYGITYVSLKISDHKILDIFNIILPAKKIIDWDLILDVEKFIKRNQLNSHCLVSIEFNQSPDVDVLFYLKEKLGFIDIAAEYIKNNNLNEEDFYTGFDRKRPARTNYLFTIETMDFRTEEIFPIYDGSHDENRYFKDAGIFYQLDF